MEYLAYCKYIGKVLLLVAEAHVDMGQRSLSLTTDTTPPHKSLVLVAFKESSGICLFTSLVSFR